MQFLLKIHFNTCPLLIHFDPATSRVPIYRYSGHYIVATLSVYSGNYIVAGVYVSKPGHKPVTNFSAINLANAQTAHPLQNCLI